MKQQLVSIIVPIYNVEKYLDKCIKSLVEQTYKNIEILLVNDGSPDNSIKICQKYSKKDERIKIIDKKNGGLSDARNKGIENSSGELICFIDGDDFIENDMIEYLVSLLNEYNSDIAVCGAYNYNFETGDYTRKEQVKKDYIIELNRIDSILTMLDTSKDYAWRACNKIYKKQLFKNTRYPFRKIYEDVGTTYKTILESNKTVYSSMPKYYHVYNPNSISNTYKFNDKELNRIEMAEQMCLEIGLKYNNKKLTSALNYFLITQYVSVVNVMIRSKSYDYSIIKNTKKLIRKHIFDIFKHASRKKVLQFISLNISFKLYERLFNIYLNK